MENEDNHKKAIDSLIHDTNSELSRLRLMIKRLRRWNTNYTKELMEKGIVMDSEPFIISEYLISIEKKLVEAIDLYYRRYQNKFYQCPECKAIIGHMPTCSNKI